MQTLGPFNLVGLSILGASLLIATRVLYGRQFSTSDFLRQILNILGWLLLVCGIVGALFGLAHVAANVVVVISLINVVLAARYFFRLEKETIIPYLATAAERGIPLPIAARAFAVDRGDAGAVRAISLASLLEHGVPLPDALERSGHCYRLGPALAVGVGSDLGCLNRSLRSLTDTNDQLAESIRNVNDRIVYLNWLTLWNCGILIFLALKILPVMQKMSQEFGLNAPKQMSWSTELTMAFVMHPLAPFLAGTMIAILLFGMLLMVVFHLELWPRDLPLLGWLTRRYDSAWVLRSLSWGVGAGRSISETLESVHRRACRAHLRRRARDAIQLIDLGRPWSHALQDVGLLRGGDGAVLDAAQRAGNLEWALDELADAQLRRLGYRLRLVTSILLPLVLVMIGLAVFGVATTVLVPLFELTGSLA